MLGKAPMEPQWLEEAKILPVITETFQTTSLTPTRSCVALRENLLSCSTETTMTIITTSCRH